jgi:hypothetical protein
MGGILGILHTAHCIATIHGMRSGRIRLGLDGEEAMKQAAIVGPIHPKMRSFDLLAEIRALRSRLAFTVDFFWIEGHQHGRHGKEDYYGYSNNLCDNLAKAFWNQTTALDTCENVRVNFTSWGFRYKGVWPGQFSSTDFYGTTFGEKVYIPYWQDDRHPIPPSGLIQVDWITLGKAFSLWPRGKRQWLTKHLARFLATGRVMYLRKEWSHDHCPICNGSNEDSDHINLCPASPARAQWDLSLDAFQLKLQEYHTHPDIEHILMAKQHAWPHTVNMSFGADLDPIIGQALLSQDTIGWTNLLYGHMSGFWQDAQQAWLVQRHTLWKPSASWWMSRTMRALWEISWEMWMHCNHIFHSPTHPWRLAVLDALDTEITQEWESYNSSLYFRAGQQFFSGDLQFLLSNYSAEAKRKLLSSIRAARAHRQSYHVSETRIERAGMAAWLQPS